MVLNITQKNVLRALVENKDKWMGVEDIYKSCLKTKHKVNRSNIGRSISFLLENKLITAPNSQGKVKINEAGIDVFFESGIK
ncbi:MAG: hypothetical protein K5986_09370 [Clostridium sp.]|uniref:hypothetical protein n=1 Tax=Clostridium sp. DSM 8431 TaxID=1761781 RepID=UPI0008EF06E4|nr:hypothetical protein [Clostridium sp. DSM 8431]MCR4944639.1 hypothetical protein [Clostridium sp.]SFU45370.1 hypothetical protein SAMN04487886_103125 [Clostridium sp. DSM 8431]